MALVANKDGIGGADSPTYSASASIAPATKSETVVPSDTLNLSRPSRELFVGGAGVIAVVKMDNTVQNLTAAAGARIPIVAKRVNSTNTTATLIVALS